MLFVFIVTALAVGVSGIPTTVDVAPGGRIVNGTDAKVGEYPFMVSLRPLKGRHKCGATIITESWVLTAAHCVHRSNYLFTIQAGTTQLSAEGGTVMDVYQAYIHPLYSMYHNGVHDIAILELMHPLNFSSLIQPVQLPKQMQATPGGTPATVIGWGRDHTGGSVMKNLQVSYIVTYSDEDCYRAHSHQVHPYNICAGTDQGGKGPCNGDSGGPLLADGHQVGIVSWSVVPCTVKGYPGVYTEVAYYIDWIHETIERVTHGRQGRQSR